MIKKIICLMFFLYWFWPLGIFARENVDYWYIKDFHSDIQVNQDSSLLITEKIVADCGRYGF